MVTFTNTITLNPIKKIISRPYVYLFHFPNTLIQEKRLEKFVELPRN